MRKKFLMIIACIGFCTAINAQVPPTPSTDPTNTANQGIRGTTDENAPIVPATLLLLGLGGATVGTMVYRNSKKKEE